MSESKHKSWKIIVAFIVATGIVWRIAKFSMHLGRIAFPITTKPTPTPDFHFDFTFTYSSLKEDWFVPAFTTPRLNISDEDLHHDLDLLHKYQKSNSDDDFWTLIKTLQKQKAQNTTSQPTKAIFNYSGTEQENATQSNSTDPSQDVVSLDGRQLSISTQTEAAAENEGAHTSPATWFYPVPSDEPPPSDKPVLSSNTTTKSENLSNGTAQSNNATRSNLSTLLFRAMLPTNQTTIS